MEGNRVKQYGLLVCFNQLLLSVSLSLCSLHLQHPEVKLEIFGSFPLLRINFPQFIITLILSKKKKSTSERERKMPLLESSHSLSTLQKNTLGNLELILFRIAIQREDQQIIISFGNNRAKRKLCFGVLSQILGFQYYHTSNEDLTRQISIMITKEHICSFVSSEYSFTQNFAHVSAPQLPCFTLIRPEKESS